MTERDAMMPETGRTPPMRTAQAENADRDARTGRFQPGNRASVGKSRHPYRFAKVIRDATGDGAELADGMIELFRTEREKITGRAPGKPDRRSFIQAAYWLAERGWGRARSADELRAEEDAGERADALADLSEEELRALLAVAEAAAERSSDA